MSSSSFPLSSLEKQIKTHALLCATGFLILLPIGVLIPRYTRTFTNRWFPVHFAVQLFVAGPVIFAGRRMDLQLPHFVDPHQQIGLALLILYVVQLVLGMLIHWVKMPALRVKRRPPQNYLHAVLGLAMLALAAYQVHYGLYTEWAFATGGAHQIVDAAKHACVALVVLFWSLYGIGLAFLPRQLKQEKVTSDGGSSADHIQLKSGSASIAASQA
ncbi:hypothetical protein BDZ89DRAFT_1069943 [Hymenopellis radicata]|nr:hypothetical protein BDZ89DRAFT_1069943 [Hymenopellis radicata]